VGRRNRNPSVTGLEEVRLIEDLTTLCHGPVLTVRVGRDRGEVTLKSGGRLLYSGRGGRAWRRVTRGTRAGVVLAWVRDAACIARGRLKGAGDDG